MRAIILCAGRGVRCLPATLFIPKPLIPVRGASLLERQLSYLRDNGITKITLVLGYMANKYEHLIKKYGLEARISPCYATANNNTSLALVSDLLEDSLVIDGDLYFTRDWLGDIVPGHSQFLTQPVCGAPEWGVLTETISGGREVLRDVVKWVSSGYGLSGVSYWQGEAAAMLAEEIKKSSIDEYWEEAAIRAAAKTSILCIKAAPYVKEIDSLQQARMHGLIDDDEIAAICDPQGKAVKLKGLTNSVYLVNTSPPMALRVPGKNTEKFIDRSIEPKVVSIIADEGITPRSEFYADGFKLCEFLAGHRISAQSDMGEKYFEQLSCLLGKMHAHDLAGHDDFQPTSILGELKAYEGRVDKALDSGFSDKEKEVLCQWANYFDKGKQVLCHRDLLLENILVKGDDGADMQLIDFEYAGFTHPLWDTASFILEADLQEDLRLWFFRISSPDFPEIALVKMEILVDYIWGMWGYVNHYDDYALRRLHRAKTAYEKLGKESAASL